MSTKEKSSQLQTTRPEQFDIEHLKKITEGFSDNRIIGRGGFGIVYKAKHNGKFIAVKKLLVNKPETTDIDFQNEVLSVMSLSHPNIVRLVGYCSTTVDKATKYEGKPIFLGEQYRLICFEYLPNGSLDKYVDAYVKDKSHAHWNERYNIIKGICRGLHYLHGKNILHLDLKPANVLLDVGMIPKIADFGLSRLRPPNEEQIHTKNIKGTLGYMPPENMTGGTITISKRTDIYSLGVIVMEIIAGERKYPDDQLDEVRREWEETPGLTSEEHKEINKCIELALHCMSKEPQQRPYMEQVIKILGISEDDMNHHPPDGIEDQSVISIVDSSEVDPLLEQRHGMFRRRKMTADKKSSPPETPESSTTAVTTATTQQHANRSVCGIRIPTNPIDLGLLVVAGFVSCALVFMCVHLVPKYVILPYKMWSKGTVFISVMEASFTRFDLATSSPVLTYDLSAMVMGIYNPSTMLYVPMVTKPLEAAFVFGGQRLYVVRLLNKGYYLTTMFVSTDPLSGNVTLDAAGVAEYRRETSSTGTGLFFEVEVVVAGQVMYSSKMPLLGALINFTICKAPLCICTVQATCPFKLRLALPDGGLELFQQVACLLHRNCS